MSRSNRLASEKMAGFEALAAYANMGDAPEDWRRFRLMYPTFFPTTPSGITKPGFQNLAEWMYAFAEEWKREFAGLPEDRRPLPPLLWYRNRLRAVWASNDRHGYNLAILLGFDQEAKKTGAEHPGEVYTEMLARHVSPSEVGDLSKFVRGSSGLPEGKPVVSFAAAEVDWKSNRDLQQAFYESINRLPPGKSTVDGVTGEIRWQFGCEFQQALYELMRCRWRAKVCPQCGRFFVATKPRRNFCSTRCTGESRKAQKLAWWNETGSKRRARVKARKQ